MNDIYSNELGDLLQDTCNKMSMLEPNYTKIKKINKWNQNEYHEEENI